MGDEYKNQTAAKAILYTGQIDVFMQVSAPVYHAHLADVRMTSDQRHPPVLICPLGPTTPARCKRPLWTAPTREARCSMWCVS